MPMKPIGPASETAALEARDCELVSDLRVEAVFAEMVIDGFAFDVEFLYLCERRGLRVKEVPVTWRNSPQSTVSIIGSPPKMLFDLMRLWWRFRNRG